jgi:DNA polymerase-3 subunit delta
MKYSELEKNLSKARLPAYNIFGNDDWLVRGALKRLTGLVVDFPDMNINYLSEKADGLEIKEACELLPMMGDLRVVVAAPTALKKDGAEILNAYLKKPNPSTALVLLSGEEPIKGIKDIEAVDCGKLSASAINKIIAGECAKAGVSMNEGAAFKLIEYCGNSMTRISGELQKLIAWAGAGGKLDDAAVALMVEPESEYRIYQLADAAAKGSAALCMKITAKSLADKIAPSAMLAGLYSHFRRLLYCAVSNLGGDELTAVLGVKPFAAENARRQAKMFTKMRLKRINDLCNQSETNIKSGKMYEYNALILTLMYIVNSERRI